MKKRILTETETFVKTRIFQKTQKMKERMKAEKGFGLTECYFRQIIAAEKKIFSWRASFWLR